jgi:tetratricopeptide (TPR) repeat protein
MYEHRMYLSLAAVVAVATVGGFELGRNLLSRQPQTRRVLEWGGTGALVLVLAILTIQRNRDYISEMTIWQDTVEKCPNNPRAHYNLGFPLAQLGRLPEAIGHWEQALRLKPDYAEAHNNLGAAFMTQGRLPEAIGHYEQSLQINPQNAEAQYNLGMALVQEDRPREAIEHWEQALRIKPENVDAHYNLGVALEKLGRTPEAIQHYQQALRITPDFTLAQNALARLQAGQ